MDEGGESGKGQPLVTGLLRGLQVLRCFDVHRQLLGSSDIARMTGLPQPTVWRLCRTLVHGGYLVEDQATSRFRPGLSILALGYAALDTLELAELAMPLLKEVALQFRGGASLSTREGTSMLYLQRFEAPNSVLNVNVRVGSEVPIVTSGTGWAYLAGVDSQERAAALRACKRADARQYALHEAGIQGALDEYAAHGFISNVDVFFPGLATVAVPLIVPEAAHPYVLNCTTPTALLKDPQTRAECGAALKALAVQLRPIVQRGSRPAL